MNQDNILQEAFSLLNIIQKPEKVSILFNIDCLLPNEIKNEQVIAFYNYLKSKGYFLFLISNEIGTVEKVEYIKKLLYNNNITDHIELYMRKTPNQNLSQSKLRVRKG